MRVIDFFCGAGGFSEGFRQQGFEIVAGVDYWKPAIETFNFNFGLTCTPRNMLDFENSIVEIEKLPDTEIIIGSPPCVSFSSSNKSGKADKSMGLRLVKIFLMVIAIKKHKPRSKLKAWFMENVTNSKVHLPETYTFNDLGLRKWAINLGMNPELTAISLKENQVVINSADFGTPQNRPRVFTGEFTKSNKKITPTKTHQSGELSNKLSPHISLGVIKKSFTKPNSHPKSDTLISDPLYPDIQIKVGELTDHFYDTGLYSFEWQGSKFLKTNHPYMGKMSFPENEEKPSRTITATKIGNSREAIIYKSEYNRKGDGEFRTPTVREAAVLMGFPITYQFIGSENSKWRLVGNAVCPPVSRAFAKLARETFELNKINKPIVKKTVISLDKVNNLNTFTKKEFNNPPKRKTGSRFRRHPFKYGNLTVTLSNYNIEKNNKSNGTWYTSVQYGTGAGFPIDEFEDGYYKKLEPTIKKIENGVSFINFLDTEITKKVPSSETLQKIYEGKIDTNGFLGPEQIVDKIAEIIENLIKNGTNYFQVENTPFKKKSIPTKQLFALYAVNKVCTSINGG